MRHIVKPMIEIGTKRVKRIFTILPTVINGVEYWLESITVEQEYNGGFPYGRKWTNMKVIR